MDEPPGTHGSLPGGPIGATVGGQRPSPSRHPVQEQVGMRTKRMIRSLVIAGSAAALSILSIVSTVMAATGGGDFPRFR